MKQPAPKIVERMLQDVLETKKTSWQETIIVGVLLILIGIGLGYLWAAIAYGHLPL